MAKKTFTQEVKEMTPEQQKALIETLFQEMERVSQGTLYTTEQSKHGSMSGISQKIFRVARMLYGLDENGNETEGVKECRRRAFTYLPRYRKLSSEEQVERDIDGFLSSESQEGYEAHLFRKRRNSSRGDD